MNNKQVAGAFARGEKGKSNNMFINGDKIYSYGYHFTIAKRLPNNDFLFNSKKYSPTTAKHKNLVKRALEAIQATIIICEDCDITKQVRA
jgi:hypothetical protein